MLERMNEPENLITVYRSMDPSAEEDCAEVAQRLKTEGIQAVVLNDSAPGVPEGVFEVRVNSADAARADAIANSNLTEGEEPVHRVDPSHDLDLETIFYADSLTAEFEANSIKNILEEHGIDVVIVGDSVLPNLNFEVRVPRENVDQARALIEQAQNEGPRAADEAELESETGSGSPA